MAQSLKVNKATTAPVVAEFLGTAVLVMLVLILTQTTAVSYFIGTSAALALGVVYMMFGGVSGGHFNPAITIGVWTSKKITQSSTAKAIAYIVAQMLGGLASWQLYQYFINHKLISQTSHYTFPVFLAEAVGTMVLAFGFSAASTRAFTALESALTYGFALFTGIMVAATAAAAYLNPAVAFGLRGFSWTYVVAPIIGAVVGVNIYNFLFAPAKASGASAVVAKVRRTTRRK